MVSCTQPNRVSSSIVDLCSIGISGNALALEDEQSDHFLSYTTGNEMKSLEKDGLLEKSDSPESLFGGEAGRAWCWAVADKGLEKRVLGYNDL